MSVDTIIVITCDSANALRTHVIKVTNDYNIIKLWLLPSPDAAHVAFVL